MPSTPSNKEDKPRSFWDRYMQKLNKSGIKPPFDRWMVIRADQYLAAHPGLRLTEQGPGGWITTWLIWVAAPASRAGSSIRLSLLLRNLVVLTGVVWLETASWPFPIPATARLGQNGGIQHPQACP